MEEDSIKGLGKKIGLLATIAALGVVGATGFILAAENNSDMTMATPAPSYTCASVHFGMDDETLTGDCILTNSEAAAVGVHEKSLGVPSGIGVLSYEVTNQAVNIHANAGLKMSSSSNNSTLAITFDSVIIGCDIYAVGWKGDSAKLSVNGSAETSIASNDSITGTSMVKDVKFSKYHFDLSETSTLTLAATKRLIIGDIALRVKA